MVLQCSRFHPVINSTSSGLVFENLRVTGCISLDITEELRVSFHRYGPFSEIETNIYMHCFQSIMRMECTCFFCKKLQVSSIRRTAPYHSLFVCTRLFTRLFIGICGGR